MKRTLLLLTVLALLIGCFGAQAEELPNITIGMVSGAVPVDVQSVENALNELLAEKIGVTVSIQYFTWTDFVPKMNLILASRSESMDIIPIIGGNWPSFVSSGKLLDMTESFDKYGEGIREYLEDVYLDAGRVNGQLLGVPAIYCWAENAALIMRTDVLEKAGLETIPETMDLFDLTDVFAKIYEQDSSLPLVGPDSEHRLLNRVKVYDPLTDSFGVLMNNGQSDKVENWFATEEYERQVKLMREWNLAGYVAPDSEISVDGSSTLVRNGVCAGWIGIGDPGSLSTQETLSGYDLTLINLTKPLATTSSVGLTHWSFPVTCQDTDAAMKVLNEMYCNPAVVDLLDFGVEGIHYVRNEEGLMVLPEGVTPDNAVYYPHTSWYVGNQFISSMWDTDGADFNSKMADYVKDAEASSAMGFTFDNEDYAAEIAALTSVLEQYRPALECGVVDPDEVLPQFIKALEDAGINDVIAAKQEQLDAWRAAK